MYDIQKQITNAATKILSDIDSAALHRRLATRLLRFRAKALKSSLPDNLFYGIGTELIRHLAPYLNPDSGAKNPTLSINSETVEEIEVLLDLAEDHYSAEEDTNETSKPLQTVKTLNKNASIDRSLLRSSQEIYGKRAYGYMIDHIILYALDRLHDRLNKSVLFEILNKSGFPIQDDVLNTKLHRHRNHHQTITWDASKHSYTIELTQKGHTRRRELLIGGKIPHGGINYIEERRPEVDKLIEEINQLPAG